MAHFCDKCGGDEYICQVCARVLCTREQPGKYMRVPGKVFNGMVCQDCQDYEANLDNIRRASNFACKSLSEGGI
jgi:hypothetical protein